MDDAHLIDAGVRPREIQRRLFGVRAVWTT
jgi:hypothetical protein